MTGRLLADDCTFEELLWRGYSISFVLCLRTLSSEPAFLIQTINLEVALLLRQSLID